MRRTSGLCCQRSVALPRRQCQRLAAHAPSAEPSMGLSDELKLAIDKYVSENRVVLFMKGNREFPQCGFSNTCVQILNMLNVPYETVNILEDERLRSGMKEYSQWPTFPQVYISGEFFGGCDIMIEAYQSGELVEVLEAAASS
ncbi:hypothetical protein WJX81_003982 [Elliptochloris bilobata]|uniref:Glutaredoxin domain-containing protein n=1 Tax=Elliptochloris bilobata TaxID=381761 RepID=A0AAW1REC5_9CHLO